MRSEKDTYKEGHLCRLVYKIRKMYIASIQGKKIEYFHIQSFFLYSQVKIKKMDGEQND